MGVTRSTFDGAILWKRSIADMPGAADTGLVGTDPRRRQVRIAAPLPPDRQRPWQRRTKVTPLFAIFAMAAAVQACSLGRGALPERSGSIVATINHSEWTPPARVSLDLRTGRFEVTPAPPWLGYRADGPFPVRQGTLSAGQLREVRVASVAAVSEGLEDPVCQAGGAPPRGIIISNSGRRTFVLTRGSATLTAPPNLGCWTEAGQRLYQLIEARFFSEARF